MIKLFTLLLSLTITVKRFVNNISITNVSLTGLNTTGRLQAGTVRHFMG